MSSIDGLTVVRWVVAIPTWYQIVLRKLLLGALLILPTSAAWAVTVYLNGVAITGVPNQTFKNCTVTTDASGNVTSMPRPIKLRLRGQKRPLRRKRPQQAGLAPTQRYWLITERTPEMADYDIDVFVNGKWLRKFLNEEERQVVEISKYFKTGPNKVALMARKRKDSKDRNSSSPAHYFRIVIGAGKMNGRSIMVTESLVDYRRTAAEVDDRNDIFTVTIR